jgi:hypothetical protein
MPEMVVGTLDEQMQIEAKQINGSLALVYVDFVAETVYININAVEIGSIRPTLILSNALALILEKSIRDIDALRNLTPLNSMLDTAVLVGDADDADPASMLQPLLDRLEILRIDHVSLRRGVPGELLHQFDSELLQLTPLRQYLPGELVAFRDQSGAHRYAEVVRVEDAALDGGAFSSVVVRIHPTKTALLSSADLFSFSSHMSAHSVADDADQLLHANQRMQQMIAQQIEEQRAAAQLSAPAKSTRAEGGPAGVPTPAMITSATSSAASSASSSSSSSSTLDRSRLQLLSAVSSLLQQAQLPLSLDTASLVRENLLLRQQFESSERKASATHARESQLNSRIEQLQSAYTCPICATADCNLVLVRCGHQLCSTCESQLHNRTCPFCRTRYEMTVPFFRPEI